MQCHKHVQFLLGCTKCNIQWLLERDHDHAKNQAHRKPNSI